MFLMVRIGTSGWLYDAWRATFYPSGLPQRAVLPYIAHQETTGL